MTKTPVAAVTIPVSKPHTGAHQRSHEGGVAKPRATNPYTAYTSSAPPKAWAAQAPLLIPSQALPTRVPTKVISISGHKRRNNAAKCPPAVSCQRLVKVEGTMSSAAACAGDIATPSTPMATVGKPRPITPFTAPARTKVSSTSSDRAGPIS
ncbi:hypothetical protein D3C77_574500 [compost metagenome]